MTKELSHPAAALAAELVAIPSILPDRSGVQRLIGSRLEKLGFATVSIEAGNSNNLWARLGTKGPLFVFAGHSDVVAPGDERKWDSPPFKAEVRDGKLFGRGAADMKGGLAAMVVGTEAFLNDQKGDLPFSIGFLIAGDEEGPSIGTPALLDYIEARGEKVDFCIVGEPTSEKKLGDAMKIGRRGSVHVYITIHGVQGHVGYPSLAKNAIHEALPALSKLSSHKWDNGNEHFEPTSFQFVALQSGAGENIVPGELRAHFNVRHSTEVTADDIEHIARTILSSCPGLAYELTMRVSAVPFLTVPGALTTIVSKAAKKVLGTEPAFSTKGGTSDGRFVAARGGQVVEFGLINESIHKVNENASVDDILNLSKVYAEFLREFLSTQY